MSKYRKPIAVASAAALCSVALVACGGGATPSSGEKTLYYLANKDRAVEHWDPQRMYIGRDLSNSGRLFYRSLVANPVTDNVEEANQVVPDLATDTGTSKQGGKVWEFTLKDGVKWEDGKDVTCEDLKYGMSRSFATDVITGGPNYILGLLDVPADPKGGSAYKGPYTKKGQDLYDKAVTCSDKTITYRFNKAFPDFPLAIASLRAFDPYREDKDQGDKSNFQVFSNGPFKLSGKWEQGKGGTFVPNDEWDKGTDEVRNNIGFTKFVFDETLTDEAITQRLIADQGKDKFAVTDRRIPASSYADITGDVAERATLNPSPFVDYLMPNQKRLTNPLVRKALMMSTDQQGWITAGGGEKAYVPADSIVNPVVVGYKANPEFADIGNFAKAKATLKKAGVKTPYPIIFTFPGGTPTSQKQAAALKEGWEKGGFKVTLNELTETYYDEIQKPTMKTDVVWAGWGADWPSIGTVIPPLFDSRLNLSAKSNGQDYGNYDSKKANALIDKAAKQPSVEAAAKVYQELDAQLGKDTAYIPLEITQFYILHGSGVDPYIQNPATSMYPDVAGLGVK